MIDVTIDPGMRSGKGACKFYIYESDSELFILAPFPRRLRRVLVRVPLRVDRARGRTAFTAE